MNKMDVVSEKVYGLATPQKEVLDKKVRRLDTLKVGEHGLFDKRVFTMLCDLVDGPWQTKLRSEVAYLDTMNYSRSEASTELLWSKFHYFTDRHADFHGYMKGLQLKVRELKQFFAQAGLRMVQYTDDESVRNAVANEDASAGFEAIVYAADDVKVKKDLVKKDGICDLQLKAEEEARKNGTFAEPTIPGYRTQADLPYELHLDGTYERTGEWDRKVRLVWIIALFQSLCETRFSKPLQEWMGEHCYWYCGHKNDSQLNRLIQDNVDYYPHHLSIDMSSFDAHVPSWMIHIAFDILKEAFRQDENFDDELWTIMVDDFVNKVIVGPGQQLIYVTNGVPSGSMFTSMIDSIVNYLMINTYMYYRGVTDYVMFVMGDDNLTFSKVDLGIPDELHEMSEFLKRNFGMVMHPHKCSSDHDNGRYPEFLSRYWRVDGVWRHPIELIVKACYPERYRDYPHGHVRAVDIIASYERSFPLGMHQLSPSGKMTFFLISQNNEDRKLDYKYLTGLAKLQHMFKPTDENSFNGMFRAMRLERGHRTLCALGLAS
jgi:hypothetical protein